MTACPAATLAASAPRYDAISMSRRSIRRAWLSVLLACNTSPAPAGPSPAPATPEAPPPAQAVDAPPPAVVKPEGVPMTPGGQDWLVWFMRDGAPTTRWVRVEGDDAYVLAERRALIVGEDAKLWRIERKDASMELMSCDCAELEDESKCKDRQKITTLGLRAVAMDDGAVSDLIVAQTGSLHGELAGDQVLEVVGGVGRRVFVREADEKFWCGAHPDYEHGVVVYDVAAGKYVENAFDAWPQRLPDSVRKPAAEKILPEFKECQEDEGTGSQLMAEFAKDGMFLAEVAVELAGGVPTVHWLFGLTVTYACSSDYMIAGEASSGLLDAAEPLGLVPVPAGVAKAFAAIGSATAVGWSKLAFDPSARDAAFAGFSAAPEPPWPPERFGRKEAEAAATHSPAQDKLDEARKLTRAKDYPAAIAAFDAALALDSTLAAGYSGRGYARLLAGDLVAAKADLTAALTHNATPQFQAAVYFNLGQLAEKAGDTAAARAAYERSLALRPTKAVKAALAALPAR